MEGRDLLYPIQLIDVRLYEIFVERVATADDQGDEEEGHSPPLIKIETGFFRDPPRHIVARLTLDIQGPQGDNPHIRMHVSIEGLFEVLVESLDHLGESTLEEFERRSAVALLWPYAREHVHNLFQRMRVYFPLLPTLNVLALQRLREQREEGQDEEQPES